jgi:hypothetical protein
MAAKKDPVSCDDRALKAVWVVEETYKRVAFQSQSEFQAAFIARRFRLTAPAAALVASLAFAETRNA